MTDEEKLEEMQAARVPNPYWWPGNLYAHYYPETTYWWQEEEGWNKRIALWDPSEGNGMPYFRISGPDASRLLSDTCVNRIYGSKAGTVKDLVWCRDDGKMIYDTLGLVWAPDVYEISSATPLQYAMDNGDYDVTFEPVGTRTQFQVSGPKAYELLQELTDYDLTQIRPAHFNTEPIKLAGVDCYMVRLTMTGEYGFEIQTHGAENHDKLYAAVMEHGEKYGIERIGLRNHMVQHAEASMAGVYYGDTVSAAATDETDPYYVYCTTHNDLLHVVGILKPKISGSFEPKSYEDFMASPIELGMGRMINFDHDFPGKEALAEEIKNPKRKMVCLEWNGDDVVDVYASFFKPGPAHERNDAPHYDYMEIPRDPRLPVEASKVLVDGEEVAFTTSRTYMYSFRKMVSHCMMPVAYAEPGTEVTVVWGDPGHPQKDIRATVCESPYKPDMSRTQPQPKA